MTWGAYIFLGGFCAVVLFGWWWIERHEADPWEELARRAKRERSILTLDETGWHFHRPPGLPHVDPELGDPRFRSRRMAWEEDVEVKAEKLRADADYEHRMNRGK